MSTPPPAAAGVPLEPRTQCDQVAYGPIERVDIVRYAGASGDFHPIHIDEYYARRAGAPTVFAMGMHGAGFLVHAVSDWFGGPHRIRRLKIRFTSRVWPGDEIVCTGRIVTVEDGVATAALEARRHGPGPPGFDLPEEQVAIVGEADIRVSESGG
ncbi:MAG: hypothetical protein GEU71_06520 [Actinobacteria bacterium]|nr:hypothetical protein [Actinomycetota bacterium]